MEPPTKRMRLGQALYDDDEEEEEHQDELAMTPFQFDAHQDPLYELDKGRAKAATRLKSTFEHIFERYEKDFTGIGDEIDLETGEIIVNNGHIESLQDPNEDGTRSDEESTSSSEEERILRGKSCDKSQSKSIMRAASSSDRIVQPASNGWDDPFTSNHRLTSLTMAPSPFGAPPPFSYSPSLPSGQPADPTWQAPDIPTSLLQDNLGFRNQFMGFPGSLEYNSFGQPRIRSSYRNIFGQPAPMKFSTTKAFAKKALPTSALSETTDAEEDDILLGNPPSDSDSEPDKAATSSVASSSGTGTVTSNVNIDKVCRDDDTTVQKVKRKRGRPRKTTTVNRSEDSNFETTTSNAGEDQATSEVPPRSTLGASETPKDIINESQNSPSPRRNLSPTEKSVALPTEEPGRIPNTTEQLAASHRRSSRARKQPDFLGKRVFPKERRDKQKVIGSTTTTESNTQKPVEGAQGVTKESDCADNQSKDAAMQCEDVKYGSAEHAETSPNPEDEQQASLHVPEAPASPTPDNSSAGSDQSLNEDTLENSDSSIPVNTQEDKQTSENPSPTVLATAKDQPEEQEDASQRTDVALRNETEPIDTTLPEDIEERDRSLSNPTITAQYGEVGKQTDPESTISGPIGPVGSAEDPNIISAREHQTVGTPESRKNPTNQTVERPSPTLSSGQTPELENGAESPMLIYSSPEPETRTILRSRNQRPEQTTNAPPSQHAPQKISSGTITTPGAANENPIEFKAALRSLAPRRRARDLVTRESPPQEHDSQSTTAIAKQGAGSSAAAPSVDSSTPRSLTPRSNRGPAAQERKPPTPETPKRGRARDPATTDGNSSSSSNRDNRKPRTPSSSSSTTTLRYLNVSARRFALTSLVPDDPECGDELNILTPTSTSRTTTTRGNTAAITPSSMSSFRARVGLDSGSNTRRASSYAAAVPATTPRRPPGRKYSSGLLASGSGGSRRGQHRYGSSSIGAAQSSPLARTVATRNGLLATPRRPRASKAAAAAAAVVMSSSPAHGEMSREEAGEEEDAVRTPGGTVRRCGEGGFVCERDFCFTCCK